MTTADDRDSVTFQPSEADLLAGYRLALRPTPRRALAGLPLAVLGTIDIALALAGPARERTGPLAIGVALLVAYPAWRLLIGAWLVPRHARRTWRQAAYLHEPYTVTWSEAGLHSSTARATSLTPWRDYVARRDDAVVLLFFQTDALFQFIPARVLAPAQRARLAALSDAVPERRWRRWR